MIKKQSPDLRLAKPTAKAFKARLEYKLKKISRLCELAKLHDKVAFWANVAKHRDIAMLHLDKANELREQAKQEAGT